MGINQIESVQRLFPKRLAGYIYSQLVFPDRLVKAELVLCFLKRLLAYHLVYCHKILHGLITVSYSSMFILSNEIKIFVCSIFSRCIHNCMKYRGAGVLMLELAALYNGSILCVWDFHCLRIYCLIIFRLLVVFSVPVVICKARRKLDFVWRWRSMRNSKSRNCFSTTKQDSKSKALITKCEWWLETDYHVIKIRWLSGVEVHDNRFHNYYLTFNGLICTLMKYLLWPQCQLLWSQSKFWRLAWR